MACALCGGALVPEDDSLGEMLGPMGHSSSGEPIFVHRQCALWSPEVTRQLYMTCVIVLLKCVASASRRQRCMSVVSVKSWQTVMTFGDLCWVQVYQGDGVLLNVDAAVRRGRTMR